MKTKEVFLPCNISEELKNFYFMKNKRNTFTHKCIEVQNLHEGDTKK